MVFGVCPKVINFYNNRRKIERIAAWEEEVARYGVRVARWCGQGRKGFLVHGLFASHYHPHNLLMKISSASLLKLYGFLTFISFR
jgi:hypothetical protein